MGIKGPRTPRGRTHYESPCGTQALRGKDVFLLTEVIEETLGSTSSSKRCGSVFAILTRRAPRNQLRKSLGIGVGGGEVKGTTRTTLGCKRSLEKMEENAIKRSKTHIYHISNHIIQMT